MRIRDATYANIHRQAVQAIIAVSRCRAAELSSRMSSVFLRNALHCDTEASLHFTRKTINTNFHFSLETLDDQTCLQRFRFSKADIYRIVSNLEWPDDMNTTSRRRYKTNAVFSFCVLARRLGTVCHWCDLEAEFGLSMAGLSEIFYEALEHVYLKFGSLVETFQMSLMQERASKYDEAIHTAGAPLEDCVGFIDGTNIYIARPKGSGQRATYNGHKRRNAIKMQAITTPDGLMFHVAGPVEGRRHDMTLFRQSGVAGVLQEALIIEGRQFFICGDPAYVLRPYLQVCFPRGSLTAAQLAFNQGMAMVRISVEWAFKDVKKYFTHVDFSRKNVLGKVPVAKWFIVSAILWNFRACFYGAQTSRYFDCAPPAFEEYVALASLTKIVTLPDCESSR